MGGTTEPRRCRTLRRGIAPILGVLFVIACASDPPTSASTETLGDSSGAGLSEAIDSRDTARVLDLVEQGVDLERPLVFGLTPLMRAANRNHARITEVLIEGGADVHAPGMDGLTPVHVAARADSVEALNVLLQAGADPTVRSRSGMNALDHAAHAGAVEALDLLVGTGRLDLDEPSEVVTQGHGYPRDEGPTPLAIAVRAGRLEATRGLLEGGADVNQPSTAGHTPLLVAVFSGQSVDMVEVLLDAGADREVRARCARGCSSPDGQGAALTAEQWAAILDRTELIALFASA